MNSPIIFVLNMKQLEFLNNKHKIQLDKFELETKVSNP